MLSVTREVEYAFSVELNEPWDDTPYIGSKQIITQYYLKAPYPKVTHRFRKTVFVGCDENTFEETIKYENFEITNSMTAHEWVGSGVAGLPMEIRKERKIIHKDDYYIISLDKYRDLQDPVYKDFYKLEVELVDGTFGWISTYAERKCFVEGVLTALGIKYKAILPREIGDYSLARADAIRAGRLPAVE